jgi:hypothetical protein
MKRLTWRTLTGGLLAVGAAALVAALVHFVGGQTSVTLDRPVHAATLRQRFAILSAHHSNKCGLRPESLNSIASNGRLQGSCCTAMNFSHYERQIRGLREFASEPAIPRDPYDISVRVARRLTGFAATIHLDAARQASYKRAMKLADEHGPCCCHCWRWKPSRGRPST